MTRTTYGDRRECATCGTDIEFFGKKAGWLDRGGNKWCDTSGQSWMDLNAIPHRYPHRRHSLVSTFVLPPGAQRL
jgi:hypothetical protein